MGRLVSVLGWLLALGALAQAQAAPARAPAATPAPRYLVLCMDGVAYEVVEEMYRRGELRHFQPPVPLITAFPTLTNVGLVEILAPLGAPPARGYEDYYFDPRSNRMRGGFFQRFTRRSFIDGTYRALFHYHANPVVMTLEYALPLLGPWIGGRLSLRSLRGRFLKSKEPIFFAYLDSTDPGAHLSGKWLLRHMLRRVERLAAELNKNPRQPVEVIIFSDHGNEFGKMRKAKLSAALQRAGFRPGGALKDARSVVVPKYGLVGSAVVYTQPGREAAAAEALRSAEGVDLVAYRGSEGVELVGPKGAARIERRSGPEGDWYRYLPASGDPLELEGIVGGLSAAGRLDGDGFAHEQDWPRATAGHIYPDPLRRLWFAFEGLVAQPASVIVSLADGYYTGSPWLDLLAKLLATHGNLRRTQTLGVAMSTIPGLFPPAGTEGADPLTGRDLLKRILPLRHQAPPIARAAPVWTETCF